MAEEGDQNDTDRSQDPTQKRLDEALKRGDVAKSQEVSTWFVIARRHAGARGLQPAAMSGGLSTTFRGLIANAHQIPVDGRGLIAMSAAARLRGAGGDGDPARCCSRWRRSPAT